MKSLLASFGSLNKPASGNELTIGFVFGIVTWLFGDLTYSLLILCVLTGIDFITGLMKAGVLGEITSSKMSKTAFKLFGYIVFIALMHIVFYHFIPHIQGFEEGAFLIPQPMVSIFKVVPHFIIAMLSLREISSNIENLTIAGIIPERVASLFKKILHRVNDRLEKTIVEKGENTDG